MVAKFSRLLTCQIVIGTKNLRKNPHFSVCSIRLLADIDLRECHLVSHAQASEVAQKMVEKHFGDISGALPIFDDIIIGGRDEQEHDLILRKVLTRARERNIKFNRDKIQFPVNKVKYMGEVVSELGFSPDPDKISAIHNMPTPSCKQDLQSYWA